MKKYFTKYLPVEGEIRDGDLLINPAGTYEYYRKILDITGSIYEGCKKVKLFLCSRDTYYGEPPEGRYIDSKVVSSMPPIIKATKIIGEISPEATWVTEGMEFDENEVKEVEGKMYDKVMGDYRHAYNNLKFIQILGPCKHFH